MKGQFRFSPSTGAELGREKNYPGSVPLRESLAGDGELTNGALTSESAAALYQYFCRVASRATEITLDDKLRRTVYAAIVKLREPYPWDCWLWYALAERLHRLGYVAEWMLAYVEARCPRCSGRLQYDRAAVGFDYATCASRCGAESHSDRTVEIRERILGLYESAFGDEIERLTLVDGTDA